MVLNPRNVFTMYIVKRLKNTIGSNIKYKAFNTKLKIKIYIKGSLW